MASEVKYAPKAVIDELDDFEGTPSDLFSEDEGILLKLSKTGKWVFLSAGAWQKEREIAVYNHVFGDERLQPEREPRYYVNSIDVDGEDVTYYLTDLRILDFCQSRENVKYECGMSKQLAEAIVAEIGGTIEEIK